MIFSKRITAVIFQTLSGQFPAAWIKEVRHNSVCAGFQMIEELRKPGIVSPLSRQSHEYQGIPQTQRVVSLVISTEQYGF